VAGDIDGTIEYYPSIIIISGYRVKGGECGVMQQGDSVKLRMILGTSTCDSYNFL